MNNSDYFWLGFTVCFVMVCVLGMVLVYLTATAEAIKRIRSKEKKS